MPISAFYDVSRIAKNPTYFRFVDVNTKRNANLTVLKKIGNKFENRKENGRRTFQKVPWEAYALVTEIAFEFTKQKNVLCLK